MDDDGVCASRQPKRKQRNQAEWKREKRKRSIIAGESHLSVKGQLVDCKQIGPDCKCKLKCYEKVEESTRQMLFDGFYALQSYDEQNAYLFGLIRKHDVKRKKNVKSERRTCTYKYYVRNRGKEIQVCKLAFAHIHSVSFRKIRTLSEKLDQNVLFPRDGRGKHDNRPKRVSQETLDRIKQHIFTIIKSSDLKNYMKEDKNRQIVAELNVAKLYTNFLVIHEAEAVDAVTGQLNPGHIPKVKSWLYRKVFHEEVKTKDFQTIRKRLDSLNNAREDRGGPSNNHDDAPAKKSRRKGMARKIVPDMLMPDINHEPVHFQPKPVHYPILTSYNTQSIEMQVPRLTPQHKPIQHHPPYQQPDHSLQEFTHNLMRVNKDNRMPQMHGTITHHHPMPMFEHRVQHYQDASQQHLDVNEMTNAFMYSSTC